MDGSSVDRDRVMTDETDEFVRQQLNREVESLSLNQLNDLGNQAIASGLIAGHGHHQGQYEIIRQGKIHVMSPQAAMAYLQRLLDETPAGGQE